MEKFTKIFWGTVMVGWILLIIYIAASTNDAVAECNNTPNKFEKGTIVRVVGLEGKMKVKSVECRSNLRYWIIDQNGATRRVYATDLEKVNENENQNN